MTPEEIAALTTGDHHHGLYRGQRSSCRERRLLGTDHWGCSRPEGHTGPHVAVWEHQATEGYPLCCDPWGWHPLDDFVIGLDKGT